MALTLNNSVNTTLMWVAPNFKNGRRSDTVTADNLDTSPSVAGLNSVMHYVCVHRVHTVNNWSNDWLMYADDSSYMLLRGHVIII